MSVFYGTVLLEVRNHMKKTFETSTGSHPISLLAELRGLFNTMYQYYTNKVYSVYHTRFKNDPLKYMPSLKALKMENAIVGKQQFVLVIPHFLFI